jgi:hypothetical protein
VRCSRLRHPCSSITLHITLVLRREDEDEGTFEVGMDVVRIRKYGLGELQALSTLRIFTQQAHAC